MIDKTHEIPGAGDAVRATGGAGSGAAGPGPAGRRGRPRLIDRERIVRAALALPPAEVTMRNVAKILGVDRSALNYHVDGRRELLSLVASAAVDAAFAQPDLDEAADWRELVVLYARTMRECRRVEARYAPYLQAHVKIPARGFELADRLLAALADAGFDESAAVGAFGLLSQVVHSAALADSAREAAGAHPGLDELDRRLRSLPVRRPALERFVAHAAATSPDEHFAFGVSLVLAGMDALRAAP